VRAALAFLARDLLIEASYPVALALQVAGVLFSATLFYFLAQAVGGAASPYLAAYGGDYFAFVLIGLAFAGYLAVGLQAFGRALREAQLTGTLEALLMTPAPVATILVGPALGSYLLTTLRVGLYLLAGALLFGLRLGGLDAAGLALALAALVLAVLAFSGLGILAASFVMLFKRGEPATLLVLNGINLLGGVYFPVEVFAERAPWLLPLANLLPLTYALRALRLALLGRATPAALWPDLAALAVFAAVLLPAGLLAFRWAVARARIDGSFTHY
jgi:ABC-2 type transport system permease protein